MQDGTLTIYSAVYSAGAKSALFRIIQATASESLLPLKRSRTSYSHVLLSVLADGLR